MHCYLYVHSNLLQCFLKEIGEIPYPEADRYCESGESECRKFKNTILNVYLFFFERGEGVAGRLEFERAFQLKISHFIRYYTRKIFFKTTVDFSNQWNFVICRYRKYTIEIKILNLAYTITVNALAMTFDFCIVEMSTRIYRQEDI